MRTTIDLDRDALTAAKTIGRAENPSLGQVISRLVRQAPTGSAPQQPTARAPATGFALFCPARYGVVVSNERISHLRDAEGV